MSADGVLSDRKLRRIARATGLDVVRGWAWGPRWEFVTAGHVHMEFEPRTGRCWPVPAPVVHYTSCGKRWPDEG